MKNRAQKIKEQMATEMPTAFIDQDKVRAPQGWPTGIKQIDDYLIWNGVPKAALSLFTGKMGQGATSAWIEAAMNVISQGKWAAWVSGDHQLFPLPLKQKNIDLKRLLVIEAPKGSTRQAQEKVLWLLQELMSSTIFDLIGCDLGDVILREHQLQKLKNQARTVQTSLVLLSQSPHSPKRNQKSSIYSLILDFKKSEILIERALHRPTPLSISRRLSYAQFTRHTAKPLDIGIIKPNALSHPPAIEQDSGSET